jgi:NAD(P)-dependent dehydrogenase (short-subunit alcohol dehydrogenase family)
MKDLAGRGALITGGASGIGLAMAEAFAARGLRIVLCDRDAATLESAAASLKSTGAEVLAIRLDVCDRAAWQAAIEATRAFGLLHVVCANAGISPAGAPLSETTSEAWDRIVAVNLTGVFNTVHATAPLIKAHGEGGHIVLTSSMAGMLAASPIGDYAVTKFGVAAMGEALRAELAPLDIGVSILCPGVVATPLVGESRSIGAAERRPTRRAGDRGRPALRLHACGLPTAGGRAFRIHPVRLRPVRPGRVSRGRRRAADDDPLRPGRGLNRSGRRLKSQKRRMNCSVTSRGGCR